MVEAQVAPGSVAANVASRVDVARVRLRVPRKRHLDGRLLRQIHLAAVASRPKNTGNAYLLRQKEWRAWCDAEQFDEATRCASPLVENQD